MNFKNLLIHYLDNNPSGVKVCQLTDSIVEALVFPRELRGIIGYMNIAGGNFEVLPGSKIDMGSEPRSNEKVKMLRQSLLQKGNIVHEANGEWVLQKIVPFNSPSGAAAFVLGGSQNGWVEWKNADGKTLQSVREKMQ